MNSFRVGLAGCGRMGLPMLKALHNAGIKASGFDIRPPNDFRVDAGIMVFDSRAFAADTEVLFTVVRDTVQTDALLFNNQSFLAHAENLKYLVICSTLSPTYVRGLRNRVPEHIHMIDAPMSGAAIAAHRRELSFMLGGDEGAIDALMPLFRAMGQRFHRMGDFGAGMSAKVLNNLVAASSTVATRLALDWAKAQGLDRKKMLALMNDSSGQTWFGSGFDNIEFARDGFAQSNTIGILEKDVESALHAAPPQSDQSLPKALIAAIRKLKPLD